MDTIDLEVYAQSCIDDAQYDGELTVRELREAALEIVGQEAESACTYYAGCMQVIERYENQVDSVRVDDLCSEHEFTATEWRKAMAAYANAIAYVWIEDRVNELIDAMPEDAKSDEEEAE